MKQVKIIKRIYSQQEIQRIRAAKKSYARLQKEIEPFIKIRRFKQYSTIGQWCETSNYYS